MKSGKQKKEGPFDRPKNWNHWIMKFKTVL